MLNMLSTIFHIDFSLFYVNLNAKIYNNKIEIINIIK